MKFLKLNNLHLPLYFLVALATGLLVKIENFRLVSEGELINPDSYMRLVRIQEALVNNAWFANIVTRNESGAGTLIYWSHFVDAFVLLLRLPLLLIMSPENALFCAGALLGPISLGLLGVVCTWAVAPWVNRQWSILVAIATAISVPLLNYGQLGVATHHLMIVAFVVLGWGFVARTYLDQSVLNGFLAGVVSGMAIWVSPEATPYCLLGFGGILVLTMLDERDELHQPNLICLFYGVGFLITILMGVLIDPPHQGRLSPQLDRISVTFLILSLLIFVVSLAPAVLMKIGCTHPKRVFLIPIVGLVAISIWLYLFPAYLKGLNGLMTAGEASVFFITTEMSGINTFDLFCYFGLSGVLAVIAITWVALVQKSPRAKFTILYIALGALVVVGFAFWHVRFAIYSAAISVMTLGVVLSILSAHGEEKTRYARAAVIFCFLLLPGVLSYSFGLMHQDEDKKVTSGSDALSKVNQCSLGDAIELIKPLGDAVVMTDANLGPALLYRTQAKVVGSFYHAGIKGYMRLRSAWASTDLKYVPAAVIATNAQYLLICATSTQSGANTSEAEWPAKDASSSLLDQLLAGRVPSWLVRVSSNRSSGWVLYKIQATP